MTYVFRVAQIRDDHTWTEMKVEASGANGNLAADNAIRQGYIELDFLKNGYLPENIIALVAIEGKIKEENS